MFENIVPRPRDIETAPGTCNLATLTTCTVTGLRDEKLAVLAEMMPGVRIETRSGDVFAASISTAGGAAPSSAASVPDDDEGYVLSVTGDSASVSASSEAGLWYGLMSYVALLEACDGEAPCGTVRDHPAMSLRGIHLDLKGYQPRFDRLLEFCAMLSRYRINAILLEVEDKYRYECAPEVGVPEAYTREQFRELSRYCDALGIKAIPKLQALGHVDYILKHERYAHLREADHPFMFCPRNDESLPLWNAMASELIGCFAEHGYFHIGADETWDLGSCDVCREHSNASSYVHRVGPCIVHVVECGKQPVMWEDILRNAHGTLSEAELRATWQLGEKSILNYWVYGASDLDMMQSYLDAGMRVWGASAFSGAGPTMIEDIPPLASRAENIAMWTRAVQEHGIAGVIATSWTKFRSGDPPAESPDASWLALLYAAESMWSGEERPFDEFVSAASRSLWGVDISGDYGRFVQSMEPGDLPRETPRYEASRNGERLLLWQAGAEMKRHKKYREDVQYLLRMYHGTLGDRQPDYILDRTRFCTDLLAESIERCRPLLGDALRVFYEERAVAEVLVSRFGRDVELVAETRALIGKTALV